MTNDEIAYAFRETLGKGVHSDTVLEHIRFMAGVGVVFQSSDQHAIDQFLGARNLALEIIKLATSKPTTQEETE
jgi:hypothetical protein